MSDMTREKAIDTLKSIKAGFETDEWLQEDIKALDLAIEALEIQKTGHWIDNKVQTKLCNCSECYALSKVYYKFCPHCGAKMEGE